MNIWVKRARTLGLSWHSMSDTTLRYKDQHAATMRGSYDVPFGKMIRDMAVLDNGIGLHLLALADYVAKPVSGLVGHFSHMTRTHVNRQTCISKKYLHSTLVISYAMVVGSFCETC